MGPVELVEVGILSRQLITQMCHHWQKSTWKWHTQTVT